MIISWSPTSRPLGFGSSWYRRFFLNLVIWIEVLATYYVVCQLRYRDSEVVSNVDLEAWIVSGFGDREQKDMNSTKLNFGAPRRFKNLCWLGCRLSMITVVSPSVWKPSLNQNFRLELIIGNFLPARQVLWSTDSRTVCKDTVVTPTQCSDIRLRNLCPETGMILGTIGLYNVILKSGHALWKHQQGSLGSPSALAASALAFCFAVQSWYLFWNSSKIQPWPGSRTKLWLNWIYFVLFTAAMVPYGVLS